MVRRMMTMKLAAVSTITALLLCCPVFASAASPDACNQYAEVSDSVIVPLGYKLQDSDILRWKHNTKMLVSRSTTFKKGTAKDITSDGSLKLSNMDQSKVGTYTPEVFHDDGTSVKTVKETRLCILDRLQKPSVTFQCSPKKITITCNVSQAKDVPIQWTQNNNLLTETRAKLIKSVKDVKEEDKFSCRVSNRLRSLDSEPVVQTCIKPKLIFPEELFGYSIWFFVAGGGAVVVLLIIIVIVCCIRNRRKKRMQVKTEEELRLGFTNPNQQHQHDYHHHHQPNHPPNQQHHHHHHHQQQPAGHTGPRQHRTKQQRAQQRPKAPDTPNGQPKPSPRRAALPPVPVGNDDEQPPPLPQPRKKAPRTPRE